MRGVSMRSRGHWIVTTLTVGLALFALTGVASARERRARHSEIRLSNVIMAFGTMYGVDEGFVGPASPIRGVPGDELPWEIEGSARGALTTDGHLRIRVRGLVFTQDDVVPPELRGKNDEEQFRAMVSCISEDPTGAVTTASVITEGFAATEEGDSDINARVTLPNPCVAPIIFILAGSEDKWFAVTGFEAPEDGAGGDGDNEGDDNDNDNDND
jgi:hypothetical protein